MIRRLLPASLNVFGASGGRKGARAAGRLLGRLAPSWRASPLRRTVQVAALGLYLWLFFHVAFPPGHTFDPESLSDAETLPVEFFLWLDPLVGLAAAAAGRAVVAALWGAAAVLLLSLLFPRAFCGWLCPMGTLIDGFDRLTGWLTRRVHAGAGGRWTHVRYGILAAVAVAAALGVLLAGFVAPIVVLTRGMLLTLGRAQGGMARGWESLDPAGWALWLAAAGLALVLLMGVLGRRLWCRYLCPSGALLSLTAPGRVYERRVASTCTGCGKCVDACAFGAVAEDFTTRHAACTFCQTCGGACPVGAISFGNRFRQWVDQGEHRQGENAHCAGRRAMLAATVGGAAGAACGLARLSLGGAKPQAAGRRGLIRPPGSVDEERFGDLCVGCGQCIQVCPGVLRPAGPAEGFEALWTPIVVPTRAACHQDCNFCTQVCPTGAIEPLSLERKRRFKMGTARIDRSLCLAHAGEEECRSCLEECTSAGYHAIEMRWVKLDISGIPEGAFSELELEEMSRIKAPHVQADACVGCGLCEYRCHARWVANAGRLPQSAITVFPPASARGRAGAFTVGGRPTMPRVTQHL